MPTFFGRYIEPFCGGCALFFATQPPTALLCDINDELIRTLQAIRDDPDSVAAAVEAFGGPDSYYAVRAMEPASLALEVRAARFLFLNRLCFNGVYRTNRSGKFNVPRGTSTGSMPSLDELRAVGAVLRCATLRTADFADSLEEVRSGDFVYLDPPYFKSGRGAYGEYGYPSYRRADLHRLCDGLAKISAAGASFLLSYTADVPLNSFAGYRVEELLAPRHVSGFAKGRTMAREILVRNY